MKSSLDDMIKIINFAKKHNFGLIFQPVGTSVHTSKMISPQLRDTYFSEDIYFYDNVDYQIVIKKFNDALEYVEENYPNKRLIDSIKKLISYFRKCRAYVNQVNNSLQQAKDLYKKGLFSTAREILHYTLHPIFESETEEFLDLKDCTIENAKIA